MLCYLMPCPIRVFRFWKRLSPGYPVLEAEVLFAIRNEYAETMEDVIGRRTRLGFLDVKATLDVFPRVLDLMQAELGWTAAKRKKEETDARRFMTTMYLPQGEGGKNGELLEKSLLY